MASVLGIDHRLIAGTTLAVTASVAIYSTYKLHLYTSQQRKENVYESQKLLNEYLAFHYGSKSDSVTNKLSPKDGLDFPRRCAELCMEYYKAEASIPKRALDVGCAVGRSTFEMAKIFDEVIGIDYSQSFVDACNDLKTTGDKAYSVPTVGDLVIDLEAKIDPSLDRGRVVFQQGDACCLPTSLGQFGCVLAANLICRLHTPKDFLKRTASLVAAGGILVITSPYTFLREFTPRENWIGGFKEGGKDVTGFDGLRRLLGSDFDFLAERDLPFLIRETERKHQWTVSHATVWKRKQS